jgi:curved DNA-binding protein
VDVFTAILGGEADVETFNGRIKLSIPAGTQPEQVFRLAGRGLPHVKNQKEKGDLFVKLKVQIPKYLSPKQRELLEEVSKIKF